jgi:hypothetical protein
MGPVGDAAAAAEVMLSMTGTDQNTAPATALFFKISRRLTPVVCPLMPAPVGCFFGDENLDVPILAFNFLQPATIKITLRD